MGHLVEYSVPFFNLRRFLNVPECRQGADSKAVPGIVTYVVEIRNMFNVHQTFGSDFFIPHHDN